MTSGTAAEMPIRRPGADRQICVPRSAKESQAGREPRRSLTRSRAAMMPTKSVSTGSTISMPAAEVDVLVGTPQQIVSFDPHDYCEAVLV